MFKLLHFIPTAVYQKVIATHMFFDRATSMCFNQLVVLQVSVSKMFQDGEVVDLCPTFRSGKLSLPNSVKATAIHFRSVTTVSKYLPKSPSPRFARILAICNALHQHTLHQFNIFHGPKSFGVQREVCKHLHLRLMRHL